MTVPATQPLPSERLPQDYPAAAASEVFARPPPTVLHGRDGEVAHLCGLIDEVRERGGALVVRGEAGIGKSELLTRAATHAQTQGLAVLSATGVQSEARLAFAGLHQLLQPILDALERLPPPQRRAVETAFGARDAEPPDIFLVGLATLGLVTEAAADRPLLLVVEDAQWLDSPSWEALAFVARRLEMEPALIFVARRDESDSDPESGLPELRLTGVDDASALALLDSTDVALSPTLRSRIVAESAGNPLALIELPNAVARASSEPQPTTPLPLTARLESAFASMLNDLAEETRVALLVSALDEEGRRDDVLNAAGRILGREIAVDVFWPAVTAGLGSFQDDAFRFRHPLVRSAVHQAATELERRRVHEALAELLVDLPDRRAWHLAAATMGPDERVAGEIEALAVRARRRGGTDVAIIALQRAAELSEDDGSKAERLVRAAELAFELGQPARALSLLGGVQPTTLTPASRGRFTLLSEHLNPQPFPDTRRWHSVLHSARRAAATGDQDLALDLVWFLGSRSWWNDPGVDARHELVATTESIAPIDADVRVLSLLAYAAPFERGEIIAARLSQGAAAESFEPGSAPLFAAAAVVSGSWDVAPLFLSTSLGELRSKGRLAQLPRMLVMRAMVSAQVADWSTAISAAQEARTLALETGQPVWAGAADAAAALASAHRGDETLTEELAASAERFVAHLGASHVLALVQIARGAAALARGNHPVAFDHLQRLFARDDPANHWTMRWWALDALVEAGVRTGNRSTVASLVAELDSLARETPAWWTQSTLGHARALLADDVEAEGLFRVALEARLETFPFQRGRLLLSYGQWLRRQRRVEASRAPLRAAAEAFDSVGATVWGTRARQELRASGETARRRLPETWDQLTPQELQIARLAADGLTNREIGIQLYLSHRTVSTHLHRLFPKLGVTSRNELHSVLPKRGNQP